MNHTKIFDSLLEPVFIIGTQQEIVYCNEMASQISGIPQRRILRQKPKFLDLFKFDETPHSLLDLSLIVEPTPYQELHFSIGDGTSGKVQITIQPLPWKIEEDGPDASAWIIFFRDVTLEERLQRKYKAELEQKESYILELQKAQAELEKYSRGLEKMVAERTAELSSLNARLNALLDSLGQGFFIFNPGGQILDISTKACQHLLETDPKAKWVWDVLRIEPAKVEGFKKWMLTIFAEMLPFEDLAPLAPQKFPHSQGKFIELSYFPIRDSDKLSGVVVVATDKTDLVQAQKEAEKERASAKMIVSLVKSRRSALSFVREANEILQYIEAESQKPSPSKEVLFRGMHTLKGGAASFSISEVVSLAHECEDWLQSLPKTHLDPEQRIKLLNQVSELSKTFLAFLEHQAPILGDERKRSERWNEFPLSQMTSFMKLIQDGLPPQQLEIQFFDQFIAEPIDGLLRGFDSSIQETAASLGKQIQPLQIHGSDIRIPPEPYAALFSSLIHIFRNAVDHGIETADERLNQGKNPSGLIEVRCRIPSEIESPTLEITICDDGRGIDLNRLKAKLIQKGINCDSKTDSEILNHLFDSGFSTQDQVSLYSGRGVGLDAVKFEAERLGGKVSINTELGKGSQFTLRLPLIRMTTAPVLKQASSAA